MEENSYVIFSSMEKKISIVFENILSTESSIFQLQQDIALFILSSRPLVALFHRRRVYLWRMNLNHALEISIILFETILKRCSNTLQSVKIVLILFGIQLNVK